MKNLISCMMIVICVSTAFAFKPANVWKYASRSSTLHMVAQNKTFWLYGMMMQSGTGAGELLVSGSTFWLDSPASKSWAQTFDPPVVFEGGTVFSCDIFQGSIMIWGYEGDVNEDAQLFPLQDKNGIGQMRVESEIGQKE
jgi:hypothetical protein